MTIDKNDEIIGINLIFNEDVSDEYILKNIDDFYDKEIYERIELQIPRS